MSPSRFSAISFALVLSASLASTTSAFAVAPLLRPSTTIERLPSSSTKLNGMFDGLAGAFANDDMGKKENAGLKNGPRTNDEVTVNGKAIKGAVVGQKVSIALAAARVKVQYSCKSGECGTCAMSMNGRKVRACVTNIPQGKCALKT